MRRLQVPRREALGIIAMLSAWAIGHRPGGIIEKKLIHVAVEWEKDPKSLIEALIGSEWLDEFDKDRVEIHDWIDVTTRYRAARKDAKRKREERSERARKAEKDQNQSAVRPKSVRGRKHPKNVHGRSTERRTEQNEQNERTERTVGAHPRQKSQQQPQKTQSSGSSTGTTGDGGAPVVAVQTGKTVGDQISTRLATPILEAIGVDGGMAESLAKTYPAIRILHVAEHAKGQDNPGGFARKALEQGWIVPDSNGDGLANLEAALAQEASAKDDRWKRMGGSSVAKKDPEFQRRQGESEEDHFKRVRDLIEKRKSEGKA